MHGDTDLIVTLRKYIAVLESRFDSRCNPEMNAQKVYKNVLFDFRNAIRLF